jgi:FixJ family two-component response regulator
MTSEKEGAFGGGAQLFPSISDFLGSDLPDGPACLVLDVRLPERSGLDLQRELVAANRELPIIFITGTAISRCLCRR